MKKRLFAGLIALVMIVGLLPVFAMADVGGSVYVNATTGSDTDGDGTESKPYETLAKAVDVAGDGAVIYVMSDLTMTKCARFYDKNLTITSYGNNTYTITRGDNFATLSDLARSWYNPAMIEVGGTKIEGTETLGKASLVLKNITLDDAGKHTGTEFDFARTDGADDNRKYVQDSIIASYNGTGTITLGEGATLKNFGGMSAVYITGAGTLIMEEGSVICDDESTPIAKRGDSAVYLIGADFKMEQGALIRDLEGRQALNAEGAECIVNGTISGISGTTNPVVRLVKGTEFKLGKTGIISGNKTSSIATVYVQSGTVAHFYGKISENEAPAGAIFVVTNGGDSHAYLYDSAEIINNISTGKYGVIEVQQGNCSFTMNGGTISGNKAKAGAVQLRKDNAKIIINGGYIINNELLDGGNGDAGVFVTGGTNLTVELNGGTLQSITVDTPVIGKKENGHIEVDSGFNLQSGCIQMRQYNEAIFPDGNSLDIKLSNASPDSNNALTAGSGEKGWASPLATFWAQRDGAASMEIGGLNLNDELPVYVLTQKTDENGLPAAGAFINVYRASVSDGKVSLMLPAADVGGNGCAVAIVQPTMDFGTLTIVGPDKINENKDTSDYEVQYTVTYAASDSMKGIIENSSAEPTYTLTLSPDVKLTGTVDTSEFKGESITVKYTLPNGDFKVGDYLLTSAVLTIGVDQYSCTIPSNLAKTELVGLESYTVRFDLNGGSGEAAPVTVVMGETVGDSMPSDPSRTGYKFIGWNTKEDGSGIVFDKNTVVTGDITVYAQWSHRNDTVTLYTLHYESNGGTSYSDELYAYGATVKLDKEPTREGYDFTGWYSDKALTKEIASVRITKDTTVYAGWRKAEANPNTGAYVLSATVIGALAGARF